MHLNLYRNFAPLCLGLTAVAGQAAELPNAVAGQDGAVVLQPASPWHLDFAEEKCRLSRLFGPAAKPNILFFEQSMPASDFSMTLAGPEIEAFSQYGRLRMGMERDEPMVDVWPTAGSVDGYGKSYFFGQVSLADGDPPRGKDALISAGIGLDDAKTIDRIVARRVDRIVSFETGNMEAPFKALNACTFDLLEHRGLDPAKHTAYRPPAMANERGVIQRLQHEYAKNKQTSGDFALVRVQVIVELDGRASACHSTYVAHSGSYTPDPCEQLGEVRFEPARDGAGEPMRSFYAADIDLNPYSPWTSDAAGSRYGS